MHEFLSMMHAQYQRSLRLCFWYLRWNCNTLGEWYSSTASDASFDVFVFHCVIFQNIGQCRGNGVICALYIHQVLRPHMVTFIARHRNYTFQHDNIRAHFARMIFVHCWWRLFWRIVFHCRRSWRWRTVRMGPPVGQRHLAVLVINRRRTMSSLIGGCQLSVVALVNRL
jgi:hypothetical protein